MSMHTSCKSDDRIKCANCGKVHVVGELVKVNGRLLPKSDGPGRFWQTVFYFCPCDMEHPLVYDPGDGFLAVVYNSRAELVTAA